MVLCKYFQQGNCRFGQYCKFEHSFGNRSKTFSDEKNVALAVAEEVLLAERGGQWLLSCYGPFKEKKCIPGMEDLSPEEVRWEMYQAQKNGTVDQINAQFQQMCEAMKTKREALKNPTPAIVQLLEEIQNSGSENTAFSDSSKLNKGNFAFGTPQLGSQTSNVFNQKSFGTSSNLFGSTSTFNPTQSSSSIFGRTANNNATSVFGGKPSFGNGSVFSNASGTTAATSIFGGANKSGNTPFGSVQNTSTFGGLASQGSSIFGTNAPSQTAFGQPATFGANTVQSTNAFLKPQPTQTSVFGAATTGSNVFGGATSATNSQTGIGIFGQSATANSAFGGTPVFGGPANFGQSQVGTGGSVFGGQSSFGATATVSSSNNVFGGANTATSSFGSIAQNANTSAFGGAVATTSTNAFEAAPNATPFGAPISTVAAPFNTINNTAANPVFATAALTTSGPFGAPMTSFSKATSFDFAKPTNNSTTSVFGSTTVTSTSQSPFGGTAFGNTQANTILSNAVTTTINNTAQVSNPFTVKSQQQTTASPFGVASSTQASPFGNFTKLNSGNNAFGVSVTVTVDETAYSLNDCLTDDEKAIYQMNQFPVGQIPLKPPTKELS